MSCKIISKDLNLFSCNKEDVENEWMDDKANYNKDTLTIFYNPQNDRLILVEDTKAFEELKLIAKEYLTLSNEQRKELHNNCIPKSLESFMNVLKETVDIREKCRKEQLYLQAFIRVNQKAVEDGSYTHDGIKKLVFYGIKYANAQRSKDVATLKETENFYKFVTAISDFIGCLTPNDFTNLFPVAKEYNGHKYECKDYFYTMEYLNALERDKPIKDQSIDGGSVIGFLWEYHNYEVREFNVMLMTSLSKLQRLKGEPTITESLAEMLGVKLYTMHESNGKQFLLDSKGRTTALYKPLPRYLKQIK